MGMHVSVSVLVHFNGWQRVISASLLLNSRNDIYKAFLLGLGRYPSLGACVRFIINPMETAELNGKIG